MQKKENWHILMAEYLQSVRHNPFAWGSFDCCMFAADCIKAMSGVDPAAPFRDAYTDAATAITALRAYAGGLLIPTMEKVAANQDWQKVETVLRLQRGDVVIGNPDVEALANDVGLDGTLGICAGTISLFVGAKGLLGVSTIETPGTDANILMGWRIKNGRD